MAERDPAGLQLIRAEAGVVRLVLDRPDVHNALSGELIAALTRTARTLAADDTVRVVVLEGAGKSLCAGADLAWMQRTMALSRAERLVESAAIGDMLAALEALPQLLIARVHGAAYAGGTGLVAVSDIAIAADGARFALTETRLGLIPANIAPYVMARIGAAGARRCFLNARMLTAEDALHLGLVDRVVPADVLDAAVAAEVAAVLDCAPGAVAATKRLIADIARLPRPEARSLAATRLADAWEGVEAGAGLAAFFAKGTPPWRRG